MATYTGMADENGDFTVPFSANYTSGQKITVTAEKDSATKLIELYAPSEVVGGGIIQFTGTMLNFPRNIGGVTIIGVQDFASWGFSATSGSPTFGYYATSLTLGAVKTIGDRAFRGWANIISLSLASTLKSIGLGSFSDCLKLKQIDLPNGLETLGGNAFYGCSELLSVDIPATILTIGDLCFGSCSKLTSVIIRANVPPTTVNTIFDTTPTTLKIYVPSASLNAYKAATGWSTYASKMVGM